MHMYHIIRRSGSYATAVLHIFRNSRSNTFAVRSRISPNSCWQAAYQVGYFCRAYCLWHVTLLTYTITPLIMLYGACFRSSFLRKSHAQPYISGEIIKFEAVIVRVVRNANKKSRLGLPWFLIRGAVGGTVRRMIYEVQGSESVEAKPVIAADHTNAVGIPETAVVLQVCDWTTALFASLSLSACNIINPKDDRG